MKQRKTTSSLSLLTTGALLFFSTILASCSKNSGDGSSGGGGTTTAPTAFKLTDAPIDDASVGGAFVTVADLKLDGQSVSGFTKTTINLAAYVNGATQTIGTFNLASRTYSSVSFVLDFDTDASGNTPGCYVLTTGALTVKHKLQAASNVITITKNFALQASVANSVVADFDLRKMIIHQSGVPGDLYTFATSAELQNDVRVTVESQTGTVSGTLSDLVSHSDKVVAYIYRKGTYNRSIEMTGQGASNIQFRNAVSSALVASSGAYQLHFLESGAYEIYFASYRDTNGDGQFELQGTLILFASGGLDLLNLSVSSNTTLGLNVSATGLLP